MRWYFWAFIIHRVFCASQVLQDVNKYHQHQGQMQTCPKRMFVSHVFWSDLFPTKIVSNSARFSAFFLNDDSGGIGIFFWDVGKMY